MSYLENEIKDEKELIDEIEKSDSGNKLLFMGLSQSGKTSIIQVVFEGREPYHTEDILATIRFIRKRIDYSGLILYVYDVGGQVVYLDEILETYRKDVFSNVKILFYIVDIADFGVYHMSHYYFTQILRHVNSFNSDAKIYVLAHKMDLIPQSDRNFTVKHLSDMFKIDELENVKLYQTSIYEDSIIEAMEEILLKD